MSSGSVKETNRLRKIRSLFVQIPDTRKLLPSWGGWKPPFHGYAVNRRVGVSVEMVHGEGWAGEAVGLDAVSGFVEDGGKLLLLFGGEGAEHVVDLMAFRKLISHSYAETGVVGVAEFGGYVLEAVMASVRSPLLQADGAERKGKVIYHHQKVFKRELLMVHPVAYGDSAQVHEGGGLEEHQFAVLHLGDGHVAVSARLP